MSTNTAIGSAAAAAANPQVEKQHAVDTLVAGVKAAVYNDIAYYYEKSAAELAGLNVKIESIYTTLQTILGSLPATAAATPKKGAKNKQRAAPVAGSGSASEPGSDSAENVGDAPEEVAPKKAPNKPKVSETADEDAVAAEAPAKKTTAKKTTAKKTTAKKTTAKKATAAVSGDAESTASAASSSAEEPEAVSAAKPAKSAAKPAAKSAAKAAASPATKTTPAAKH